MPIQFASKTDYIMKLIELVKVEAECERIDSEMLALSNISFNFEERFEIFTKLCLQVPRDHQEHIRENTLLSVIIAAKNDSSKNYVGTGVVKKVKVARHKPMTVILQLDVIDPLNRSKR